VHERAKGLKRTDFDSPKRQDEYGTSVISIQIAKKGGFISIKNRYNSKVNNCDNTFNSNPDNIIDGLSFALKEHFKVDFSSSKTSLPDNYTLCKKQVFKFEYEYDGVYFGQQAYIKHGALHEVSKGDGQYLFEYFIYCDRTKTMSKVVENINDSFHEDFNRDYGGLESLHWGKDGLYDGDLRIMLCA
jgi:hypothetical protein